jgi:hypothetical protein
MGILLSGILLFALCSPAFAEEAGPVAQNLSWLSQNFPWLSHKSNLLWLSHVAMAAGGMGLAMRWAYDAFGRREVSVADVPTFPKYMTNPQQYRLGSLIFVACAGVFFLVLVYRHEEVVAVAKVFGVGPGKEIMDAVEAKAAPYLLIVAVIAGVYLILLKKEADWNVLLMLRDAIHSWISIPQLAGEIVAEIRVSMKVPDDAVTEVVRSSPELVAQDFQKDRATPDRIWAETCYMKWWLARQQDAGGDAIFFTERNFGFDELVGQFEDATTRMRAWKGGAAIEPLAAAALVKTIKELHNKLSRVIACYLVYRNASSEALRAQAKKFGIELRRPPPPKTRCDFGSSMSSR